MNSPELQAAINALSIRDVFLRSSSCNLADRFDARFGPDQDALRVRWKHVVHQTVRITLTDDEGEATELFQVIVALGVQLLEADEQAGDGSKPQKIDPKQIKATIEATLVAEYTIGVDPGQAALDEFAKNNASFHIWPYWREYLMSQCGRMNLPKIVVPAVQFSKSHKSKSDH